MTTNLTPAARTYLDTMIRRNAGPLTMHQHAALTAALRVIDGEDPTAVAADMPSTTNDPADGGYYHSKIMTLGGERGAAELRRTAGFMDKRSLVGGDDLRALADALDA